jgi:hypothetical protein
MCDNCGVGGTIVKMSTQLANSTFVPSIYQQINQYLQPQNHRPLWLTQKSANECFIHLCDLEHVCGQVTLLLKQLVSSLGYRLQLK